MISTPTEVIIAPNQMIRTPNHMPNRMDAQVSWRSTVGSLSREIFIIKQIMIKLNSKCEILIYTLDPEA